MSEEHLECFNTWVFEDGLSPSPTLPRYMRQTRKLDGGCVNRRFVNPISFSTMILPSPRFMRGEFTTCFQKHNVCKLKKNIAENS